MLHFEETKNILNTYTAVQTKENKCYISLPPEAHFPHFRGQKIHCLSEYQCHYSHAGIERRL